MGAKHFWNYVSALLAIVVLGLASLVQDLISNRAMRDVVVRPRFLTPPDYDKDSADIVIPDHVLEFDVKNIALPKYPSSELLLVSVSSNNTAQRQVSQNYTFGRIFHLKFITDDHFPNCILCHKCDQMDLTHCPSFRSPCKQHIFFERPLGWWCSTRKTLRAPQFILDKLEIHKLPRWLHILDDNTWINPITEILLIQGLDPEIPYFLGDDYGGFLAGGPGHLLSLGALRRLLGPPKYPNVTYSWPNGTHSLHFDRQIDACLARMQGGDWCFYHGDWALSECLIEVDVKPTDLGGKKSDLFFSQLEQQGRKWFGLSREIASLVRKTHTIALHISQEEMYEIFYNHVVPYYQTLYPTVDNDVATFVPCSPFHKTSGGCSTVHSEFVTKRVRIDSSDDEMIVGQANEDVPIDPPNPWLGVAAMGIGAFFAVGIAAIGVYSSFYMAAWAVANSPQMKKTEELSESPNVDDIIKK